MKKYYHIAGLDNKQSILEHGLLADTDGNIFLYDELEVTNSIALGQLGYSDFTILEIDTAGIKDKLARDNVDELSACFQYICFQDKIEPKYIQVLEDRKLNAYDESIKENILLYSRLDEKFAKLPWIDKLKELHALFESNKNFQVYIKKKIDLLEEL